ncbi:Gp15 family bacteriophage protein [Salinibacillus xinjiangensis]|uniref:Bacteriophage Gp15 protein n=1 Tax=Salinibacillus xinjiangensis TaxID=1229268 RepID=A0A6G1X7T6_9BACI|nr:Gp15 family bacteriophage protein [Salinibacillus xinjiangensis]MRG87007.1 hypothetical protein [Salinibacillus xinjiangensis]
MKLTDRFEGDFITINGTEYELDFSFDNILRIKELEIDDEVHDHDKIAFMFEMLVIDCELNLDLEQKRDIVEHILNHLLVKEDVSDRFEEDEQEEAGEQETAPQKNTYDFDQDAELIFASFLMDYNMDLIEQQGKLHWNKFIALFNGLSEKTPFMQVIHIRTMEVPKQNKHNQKERERILRLKRHYALNQSEENAVKEIDNTFDALGEAFKATAKKAGGK